MNGSPWTSFKLSLLVLLAAATSFLFLLALPNLYAANTAVVKIDMKVSQGGTVGLFLNDLTVAPTRLPLVDNQRRVYSFSGIYRDITLLRFDPTDAPGASVEIYGVSVEQDGAVLQQFGPADISHWAAANLSGPKLEGETFRFVGATNNPFIYTTERIGLTRNAPRFVNEIARAITIPWTERPLVLAAFVAALAFGLFDPRRRAHLLLALLSLLATVVCVRWIVGSYHQLAPIDRTVGRAGYLGQSLPAEEFATLAALLSSTAIGGLVWLTQRRLLSWRRRQDDNFSAAEDVAGHGIQPASLARRWFVPLIAVVGIVCMLVPDFRMHLVQMKSNAFTPDWDGNNALIWSYLSFKGYLPFRDFWYPYSGSFIFDRAAPLGMTLQALFRSALYCGFFYSLYRLTGRRLLLALLGVAAVALGEPLQLYWGATRYLQASVIALSYLAIEQDRRQLQPAHMIFGAFVAIALFLEPAQAIYAAPGIVAKLAFDLVQGPERRWLAWRNRLLREFAIPAGSLAVILATYLLDGQIGGFLDFYLGLGDLADASAVPTDFLAALHDPTGIDFTILTVPFVFVAIGVYERLRRPGTANLAADFQIAVGLVGYMILQKHLIRPIGWQTFLVPALGIYGYCLLQAWRRPLAEFAVLGLLLGAYAAPMAHTGMIAAHWHDLKGGPERIAAATRIFLGHDPLVAEVNAARFAPERFTQFGDANEVANWIRRQGNARVPTTYVLGDDSALYILLGQKPPYHSNDYNASPIYEQRKVLDWLWRMRPAFVVWDASRPDFDLVPRALRDPLFYNAVIEDYVPAETVGRYQILRRRGANEPVAFGFWRQHLGASLDFGHLAEVSSFDRFAACPAETPARCEDFLQVDIDADGTLPPRLSVPIEFGDQSYAIVFARSAGVHRYHVLLDRVWFWDAAMFSGTRPRIAVDRLPHGVAAKVVARAANPAILY